MQSTTNKQEATGPVKAVVLDWAGTAVDYGCMGPAAVFVDVFKRFGIRVTVAEARKFMGLEKKAHVRSLCGLTAVGGQWREKYGREPTEADVAALYRETEPMMVAAIARHAGLIPGVGFVIARRAVLEQTRGQARSLSLDLYDQWHTMEQHNGKWRFTSPTHVVRAFAQALDELDAEGGIEARHRRYCENHALLVDGMTKLGFTHLLTPHLQSPIITAFESPKAPAYNFQRFYTALKAAGFVVYPGKVTSADTFRIGNIGDVHPADIQRLIAAGLVRTLLYTTLFNTAITVLLTVIGFGHSFRHTLLFSQCIGMTICLFVLAAWSAARTRGSGVRTALLGLALTLGALCGTALAAGLLGAPGDRAVGGGPHRLDSLRG